MSVQCGPFHVVVSKTAGSGEAGLSTAPPKSQPCLKRGRGVGVLGLGFLESEAWIGSMSMYAFVWIFLLADTSVMLFGLNISK